MKSLITTIIQIKIYVENEYIVLLTAKELRKKKIDWEYSEDKKLLNNKIQWNI